ncbi:MAG TPA: sigma 54-interacting transcriptional regulator, partial [Anaerolineales bacterium]|nr:sigma 54-interacting transcriptional regulator [Anaerolineales bacterium]
MTLDSMSDHHTRYDDVVLANVELSAEEDTLSSGVAEDPIFSGIIGHSSALRQVLQLVEMVASSDATVLLLGETGTGKELIARAIHERSQRNKQAFVTLNCAAIPSSLFESELFGHERGAFTGATMQRAGRIESADRGTLFLDEVGDMPLEMQPKLLRTLQEHTYERLGSARTKNVDVRLVAATNCDLEQMIEEKQFRSDLYYRLNVFPIRIPPLRERRDDIPLLVQYFTQKYARTMGKQIDTIPAATIQKLQRWSWPGNVRELENLIERSVILTSGSVLAVAFPEKMNGAIDAAAVVNDYEEQQ